MFLVFSAASLANRSLTLCTSCPVHMTYGGKCVLECVCVWGRGYGTVHLLSELNGVDSSLCANVAACYKHNTISSFHLKFFSITLTPVTA